jgi:glycosyltransferase involved in cell wall biosynthesis
VPANDIAPEISVVVTAYDRREFARAALESVLGQSFPRGRYEVILAKNFEDVELDRYAEANGVKTILCGERSIGDMVLTAVESSRGKVVSLLDDDDIYLPGKLASVSKAMSDPSIGYYHNNAMFFGPSGGFAASNARQAAAETVISPASPGTDVLKAIDEGATFNSSCLAFQSEVIMQRKELIKGIPTGPGFSLFIASLLSGKKNLIKPERLTGYRTRPRKSGDAALREKTASVRKAAETLQTVAQHTTGPLEAILRYKTCELNVRLYLLGATTQRRLAKSYSVGLIAAPTLHKPMYRAALFLLAMLWPAVPQCLRSRVRDLPAI